MVNRISVLQAWTSRRIALKSGCKKAVRNFMYIVEVSRDVSPSRSAREDHLNCGL